MKYIIQLIALISIHKMSNCQSFIYKKNAFGQIEVYETSFGVMKETPIAKLRKSPFGYLELDLNYEKYNLSQRKEFQIGRPIIMPVQPYLSPVAEVMNTVNMHLSIANYSLKNRYQSIPELNYKMLKENIYEFQLLQNKARDIKAFYNLFTPLPKSIHKGYHNVIVMFKINKTPHPNLPNELKDYGEQMTRNVDTIMENGIVYVDDDKIQVLFTQVGQCLFDAIDSRSFIGGQISNAKAFIKTGDMISEVYFIDYLLEGKALSETPNFGLLKINIPTNVAGNSIYIYPSEIESDQNTCVGVLRTFDINTMTPKYLSETLIREGSYRYKINDGNYTIYKGYFDVSKGKTTMVNVR